MIQADRIVHTTCPYCGVGCQVDLHVKDEMIFRVDGRFDNEVNRGSLCVKGRFGYDYVHAPDRLQRPLMKVNREPASGQRQNGQFKPVPWDKALGVVAARLRHYRDTFGPDSVAVLTSAKCTNEENYLLQKLTRGIIGTNTVDHCARL